jgi:DivIVA domain-containing protein
MIQWGLAAVAVAVIGVTWLAAQGRFGAMPPLVDDRPGPDLPEDADVSGDDLRDVRLAVVTRGYSMQQVDDLLDRLSEQLDAPSVERATARPASGGAPDEDASAVRSRALGWPGPAHEVTPWGPSERLVADHAVLGWPV